MRKLPLAASLLAILLSISSLAVAQSPHFPSLAQQFKDAAVIPGSALERLIRANQDFSLLRPEEAKDNLLIPVWLRVLWHRNHPEGNFNGADPTGGYPLVLREVAEWMQTHQDLRPGPGVGAESDADGEFISKTSAAVSGEQRISGAQTAPHSESDIRVNPWDPTKIIGASNNIGGSGAQAQFYSTNSGTTWNQTTLSLQPGDAFQSDPTVDWTSDGTAWSTTIGIDASQTVLKMRAYKSIDNGATWTFDATFSGAQTDTDKQMIWVDHSNTSAFKDTLYAIWHNGSPVFVSRRTGPGGSWQTPLQISGAETTQTGIGGDIKTNANGDVFAFWPDTGSQKLFVAKSTDGGVSFGTPVQLGQSFDSFDIGVPSFNSRRALIYISGGAFRTVSKNLVYASWTDLTGASGCTTPANQPGSNVASTCKTRVWFTRSTDGGATWETAKMLNNQVGLNDQYNQWLTVDEATGALAVIYYDTVNDAGRKKVDVWYQSSFDDGVTWFPAVKVTSAQTDETVAGADSGNQFGDYNSLSGYLGVFFPSWTDRRGGASEEIWTAKVSDPACTAPDPPTIGTATATAPNQIQTTWTNGASPSTTFNIYRAFGTCAAPGAFTVVGPGVATSPYTDNAVSGATTYAYKVTGLDATGHCESAASACVEATATGACNLPPTFAGLGSVTNTATVTSTNQLSWTAGTSNCAGLVRYDVYRGTPGFTLSGANLIASNLATTTFNDPGPLFNGVAYEYIVRARDISNGVSEQNSVRKSAAPTGTVSFTTLNETFEGAGGFDNAGWSHSALSGATDWALSTAQSKSPTHSWFSAEAISSSDRVLVSPPFVADAGTTLSFWHTFAFEGSLAQCFDSGTLEYTIDGSTWTVLPDAAFTAGGFNGTTNSGFSNPIGGKRAWCAGTIGAMTQVTANLASLAGNTIKLRWHEGDDSSVAKTGWYVDSVGLTDFGTASVCSAASGALQFYSLLPCRAIDTRNAVGTYGGPSIAANTTRGFPLAGQCGIPADAVAVSANVTIDTPGIGGTLNSFAAALPASPNTSVLSFKTGKTRANNAVLMLGSDGTNDVKIQNQSTAAASVIVDVNGYFKY